MSFKLELRKVSHWHGENTILDSIDLTLPPGGVAIVGGRSGCGKSTLLELCAGLIKPRGGVVMWDDDDITGMSRYELYGRRRSMGYVFQCHALISNHSAFDNIALPLKCGGADLSAETIEKRVRALMDELGIGREIEKRFPEALSAAQLKCVAVARALVNEPAFLILDEPFSGIDPITAKMIAGVLHGRWKRGGMSILMATHTLGVWPELAAQRFMLSDTRLEPAAEAFAKVRNLKHNQRYGHYDAR
jgi:ABC-type transporter Mla maintaining outer membrane lipid asymmetry ATPase subunit MlaF